MLGSPVRMPQYQAFRGSTSAWQASRQLAGLQSACLGMISRRQGCHSFFFLIEKKNWWMLRVSTTGKVLVPFFLFILKKVLKVQSTPQGNLANAQGLSCWESEMPLTLGVQKKKKLFFLTRYQGTGLWQPSAHSDVAFWSFDVGSSYHCEAVFAKRWIVHPLTGNVSWV